MWNHFAKICVSTDLTAILLPLRGGGVWWWLGIQYIIAWVMLKHNKIYLTDSCKNVIIVIALFTSYFKQNTWDLENVWFTVFISYFYPFFWDFYHPLFVPFFFFLMPLIERAKLNICFSVFSLSYLLFNITFFTLQLETGNGNVSSYHFMGFNSLILFFLLSFVII